MTFRMHGESERRGGPVPGIRLGLGPHGEPAFADEDTLAVRTPGSVTVDQSRG